MRRFLIFLLAISAMAVAIAQDAPATLSIAKSMIAIKVADPARQVTAFEPLLSRIDGLAETLKPGGKKLTDTLNRGLADMAKVPGIDAAGDFWIVIMPQEKPADDKKVDPAKEMMPFGAVAILLPLKDAQQFKTFAAGADAKGKFDDVQIFDNYAVASPEGKLPNYAGVDTGITLLSKRDIVIVAHIGENPLTGLEKQAGPMAGFVTSMKDLLEEIMKNQQSGELGLAMVGDDLSLESFVTPVPDSPLAKSLAAQTTSTQPFTLAGYLPENLAYCSASAPMLDGAPGAGYLLVRVFSGLMSSFAEPDQAKALNQQLKQLMAQCRNGRAIGMTVPPANLQSSATLVAVYQVENQQAAAAALHGFVKETITAKDALMGGMLTNVVKIFTKSNAEMIDNVPVDLIKVVIPTGDPNAKPAPKPVTIEGRTALLNDKMLIAIGDGSKTEITNMIARVKNGAAGFTASKRFVALKAALPEGVRGFESYATLDLCRAGASLVPVAGDTKKQITKFFMVFPEHKSVISNYQEVRDGHLHNELRVPGEQLDFFCSLIKSFAMFSEANAPAKAGGNPPKK